MSNTTFSLFISILSLLLLTPILCSQPRIIPVQDPNNILFTFGSCNAVFGSEPNEVFLRIAELKPDVWTWLGDVAYIDVHRLPFPTGFPGEEVARKKFQSEREKPNYTKLRESTTVIGVWDDHDFGQNDGGKKNPYKDIMQQLWLDFIEEPQDSIRRKRPGVYDSYYLGDPSKVKVILLDTRYFKESPGIFSLKGKDMLGDEQWEWLENELKENQAEYVVIGSGVQIITDDRLLPETWYRPSIDRLFELIKKYKVGGVILISGDVHYTEIMKYPCKERVGFELYEFTSSGLTHFSGSHIPIVHEIQSRVYPDTWNTRADKYFERNFGAIRFSFGEKKAARFESRDYDGNLVLEKDIPYSELEFNESVLDNSTFCVTDISRHVRFGKHLANSLLNGEWWLYLFVSLYIVVFTIVGLLIKKCCRVLLRGFGYLRKKISGTQKVKGE